jgi:translation initiation factor 4B
LNLQKRTVSEADPNPPTSAGDSKASPFGAARPVDTARKEQEVADRKERERKDAEERAKEEKRKKDEATKADKEKNQAEGTASSADPSENDAGESTASAKESKENGAQAPRAGYEILQRLKDEGEEGDEDEEEAPSKAPQDKQAKPRESTRDMPIRKGGQGSWRRGSGQQGGRPERSDRSDKNAGPAAKEQDSDGWSTVPKSTRGRGRGGARAVAS